MDSESSSNTSITIELDDSDTEYHYDQPDDYVKEEDTISECTIESISSESSTSSSDSEVMEVDDYEPEPDDNDDWTIYYGTIPQVDDYEPDDNDWTHYHGPLPQTSEPQPNIPRDLTCPICRELVWDHHPMSTICGHVFCHSCIRQAFSCSRRCPVCKKFLRIQDIHSLYI